MLKSSVAESVDISACDSPVATPEQYTVCNHSQHNSRVNDIELRERSILSEYEEYHE